MLCETNRLRIRELDTNLFRVVITLTDMAPKKKVSQREIVRSHRTMLLHDWEAIAKPGREVRSVRYTDYPRCCYGVVVRESGSGCGGLRCVVCDRGIGGSARGSMRLSETLCEETECADTLKCSIFPRGPRMYLEKETTKVSTADGHNVYEV